MSSGLRDMDMFWLKKRDHCCATDVCICFRGSLRRRILRYNGGSFLEASVFKTDQLIHCLTVLAICLRTLMIPSQPPSVEATRTHLLGC